MGFRGELAWDFVGNWRGISWGISVGISGGMIWGKGVVGVGKLFGL